MSERKKADDKTYLIERHKETIRVTVPATWKVTFGAVNPGGQRYGGDNGWCLRFYESKDQQRAIFTDVRSFRDLSIKVERRVKEVRGQSEFEKDAKGEKNKSAVFYDEKWADDL